MPCSNEFETGVLVRYLSAGRHIQLSFCAKSQNPWLSECTGPCDFAQGGRPGHTFTQTCSWLPAVFGFVRINSSFGSWQGFLWERACPRQRCLAFLRGKPLRTDAVVSGAGFCSNKFEPTSGLSKCRPASVGSHAFAQVIECRLGLDLDV